MIQGFMIENGKMRIGVFNSELPQGWFDAPDKAERAANPPKIEEARPILKLKKKRNV